MLVGKEEEVSTAEEGESERKGREIKEEYTGLDSEGEEPSSNARKAF